MEITNKKFLSKPAEHQRYTLMETVIRVHEIFTDLDDGRLDPDIVNKYNWFQLCEEFIDMAERFEDKYCGTQEYEDDYIELSDKVFTQELLETFNEKVVYRIVLKSCDGSIQLCDRYDTEEEAKQKLTEIISSSVSTAMENGYNINVSVIENGMGCRITIKGNTDIYYINKEKI